MPRLLITRPVDDAAPLIHQLSVMGIDCLAAPLLDISFIDGPVLDVEAVQGFLLTSANGVRALAARTARRDIPCYAVGDATAREAASHGFKVIESAAGDVDDLARLVAEKCNPNTGEFLHAAGSAIAGDLAAMLEPQGLMVRRERLYEAKPVGALPRVAHDALSDGALDGVVFYSPRTAKHFDRLIAVDGLENTLRQLTLFALSENVSAATGGAWGRRLVAAHPDQESLLEVVRTCYY